jgi:hypothetical protein
MLIEAQGSSGVIKHDEAESVEAPLPLPIKAPTTFEDKTYATIRKDDAYTIRYSIPIWPFINPPPKRLQTDYYGCPPI